ncbi:hypothetical protein [Ruegeria atlantica]|uniref:Uncharacterized protein n=1 Tax=Ruegeria atlantica TaxID=81569 RepID=A0ABX1WA28_9RHOB|nr:hypothetical protein [Ruegeria atlantica]NOD30141.1 hypothetical protein [Ruegeria atlantica]
MKKSIVFGILALSWGFAASAETPDEVLYTTKINPVLNADGFREVARQCMYSDEYCRATVEALGTAVGIPPGAIVESMRLADAVGLGAYKQGGEIWYEMPAPDGYFLCRLYLKTRSATPKDESDSPIFDFTANQDGIRVYLFLDAPSILEGGRSWWDGELVGYYLKRAGRESRLLTDGQTYEPRVNRLPEDKESPGCTFDRGTQIRYACKGTGGARDGYPACGEGWFHSDLNTSIYSTAPNLP